MSAHKPEYDVSPYNGFIDVHHHVILPEYEKALVRSGAGDPSRPLRKMDPAPVTIERMGEPLVLPLRIS